MAARTLDKGIVYRLIALGLSLSVVLILTACFSEWTFKGTDVIVFDAADHPDVMDNCWACHADILEDAELSAGRKGHEQACLVCHDDWKNDCSKCHDGNPGFRPDKDRELYFSHKDHLRRLDNDCDACHPGAHDRNPGQPVSPGHDECFSCHQMQKLFDDLECQTCHRSMANRRLLPLEEFEHPRGFLDEHGEMMRSPQDSAVCAQCHDDSFCTDCHFEEVFIRPSEMRGEDVSFAFIHPGDFIHRHPSLARREPDRCLVCHSQDTCVTCHDRMGIGFQAAQERTDGFTFHGPGVNDPSSRDFHGRAARRDILSCAGCHDNGMDSNCIDCHQVGGIGGNPHPPGFRSRLSRSKDEVCTACHR